MTAPICSECAPVVARLESALSADRELRERLGDLAAARFREIKGLESELTSLRAEIERHRANCVTTTQAEADLDQAVYHASADAYERGKADGRREAIKDAAAYLKAYRNRGLLEKADPVVVSAIDACAIGIENHENKRARPPEVSNG